MKCTIIAVSISISLIPAMMIMFALAIILSKANAHNIVSSVMFLFVIVLTIIFSVGIFRKLYEHLDKEAKSYIDSLP